MGVGRPCLCDWVFFGPLQITSDPVFPDPRHRATSWRGALGPRRVGPPETGEKAELEERVSGEWRRGEN